MASPSQALAISRALSLPLSSLSGSSPAPHVQSIDSALSKSNLDTLSNFSSLHTFTHGTLLIRPMQDTDIDAVSRLISESFIENLFIPPQYIDLLTFLVKNYLIDRRALLPHVAMLVGLYSSDAGELVCCTAEISFNHRGANTASPTPVPPPDCPYICNMTVKNSLRRKGFAKLLLKTCEDLICKMTKKRDVYLHCRMVDKVPLSMFKKAGYKIVKADSYLVWLTRQKRKYLLHKTLPDLVNVEAPTSEEV